MLYIVEKEILKGTTFSLDSESCPEINILAMVRKFRHLSEQVPARSKTNFLKKIVENDILKSWLF